MKKIFYSLLSLVFAALPGMTMAESFTREVASVKEFNAALDAIGDGQKGDTYTLVCTWSGSQNFKKSPVYKMKYGRLVVKSNVTDFDKMPQFSSLFWLVGEPLKDDSKVSFVFENVSLKYCYTKQNGKNANVVIDQAGNVDTVAFRHCDLNDITQQFMRTYKGKDDQLYNIDWLEFSGCRIHDCGLGTRQIINLGHSVNHVRMNDNLIYDLPRVGSFYTMGLAGETATTPDLYFNNNTVLVSNYQYTANGEEKHRTFSVIAPGDNLGAEAVYHVNNNIFMAPMAFSKEDMMEDGDITNEALTEWFGVNQGVLYASHNVLDTIHYMNWERTKQQKPDVIYMTDDDPHFISPSDAGLADWSEGGSFQNPANSIYLVEKSSPAYTMGIGLMKEADGGALTIDGETSYLGASIMYVDKFPTKAAVNVTVNGPSFITYTIEPEQAQYYVGDTITITLNDKNTPYTTLATFKGWSDGSMDRSHKVAVTGDVNLTADYEERTDLVSAFTTFTNNRDLESAKSDIYKDNDTNNQAEITFATTDDSGNYTAANGQSRPSKLDGLDDDQKIPVILVTTDGEQKFSHTNAAIVKFSTKNLSNVKFACVTGTDNSCCKEQTLSYSTDGVKYTQFAKTTVEKPFQFYALEGILPTEADNKDEVYVRIQGTPKADVSGFTLSDVEGQYYVDGVLQTDVFQGASLFEYYGGIVISANSSSTGIDNIATENKTHDDATYNLMGLKVPANYKGIVIRNGKKFINK